jgi:hypothetical protein
MNTHIHLDDNTPDGERESEVRTEVTPGLGTSTRTTQSLYATLLLCIFGA